MEVKTGRKESKLKWKQACSIATGSQGIPAFHPFYSRELQNEFHFRTCKPDRNLHIWAAEKGQTNSCN
jgi:hypothetical protein